MPAILDLNFVQSVVKQPISKFELKSVTEAGDNMAGEIRGIRAYTPEGTVDLIHKTLSGSEMKGPAVEYQFFRKETAFYRVAVPKLEFVVNQRLQRCHPDPLLYKFPSPKVYATFNDDEDDYLVVEDVRPAGYTMPDKYTGFNYDETILVLSELAKFHAHSYFLIKYEGEKLFDLETGELRILAKNFWADPANKPDAITFAKNAYYSAIQAVAKPEYRQRLQTLFTDDEQLYERFQLPYSWTESELFPVLVLGDCWVNNILIKYGTKDDGQVTPLALKFIDFQLTRRGNIYEELLYFIYTSTTSAFRKVYLQSVLEHYYHSFEKALSRLQVPMPSNFTKDRFLNLFEKGRLSAVMFKCFAIPIQLGNHASDSEDEKKEEVASDVSEVVDPMEELMKKNVSRLRNSPQALQRLNEIVHEVFENDLI